MNDGPDRSRLDDLDARIRAAKKANDPDNRERRRYDTDAGNAWRMVIELVTGMVMGFGIGYGLDWLFGTLPLFLVIFSLLGFAAGVRVMMETAQTTAKQAGEKAQKDETHGD